MDEIRRIDGLTRIERREGPNREEKREKRGKKEGDHDPEDTVELGEDHTKDQNPYDAIRKRA